MALISTRVHGILDYAGGLGSLAAPKLIADRRAAVLLALTGTGTLATSALTDYELGVRRRLPMRIHLLIDAGTGALLLSGARALRRRRAGIGAWGPLALVGLSEIAGAGLTEHRPSDRRGAAAPTPGYAPVAGAPPAPDAVDRTAADAVDRTAGARVISAPAPPEAPGPSVNPVGSEASDVERTEQVDALSADTAGVPDDEVLVAEQESAAAAEAARIGGRGVSQTGDPALDPVYEAGGGEQDGWEAAEQELIENATHGAGHARPEQDAFLPEAETDRSPAVYGEADGAVSTELVEDQSTGGEDPGQGPGPGPAADGGSATHPGQEP
jgi:hypothetical protein